MDEEDRTTRQREAAARMLTKHPGRRGCVAGFHTV